MSVKKAIVQGNDCCTGPTRMNGARDGFSAQKFTLEYLLLHLAIHHRDVICIGRWSGADNALDLAGLEMQRTAVVRSVSRRQALRDEPMVGRAPLRLAIVVRAIGAGEQAQPVIESAQFRPKGI